MRPLTKILRALIIGLKGTSYAVKTVSINFLTRQRSQKLLGELELKIRDTVIQNVNETKYLGLQIDRHLTWKKHVDIISRYVSRAIGVLKNATQLLPQYILKNLYMSIIEPHIRYCSSVWGCCSTTDMNRLKNLQNRAVRITTNSAFDATASSSLTNFGLRSVRKLCEHETKVTTFKSLNYLAPNYL